MSDTFAPQPGPGGRPIVRLIARDGATADVSLYGGHVLSWTPAGESGSRLFLSERAEYADGKAIRGGVPVIFPQFADRGPYARHGFARTAMWTLEAATRDTHGAATAILGLADSDATRALWPFAFRLRLAVTVGGDALALALTAENPGDAPFSATLALHTYLAVDHLDTAALHGLRPTFVDSAAGGTERAEDAEAVTFEGTPEIDRIYLGAGAAPLRLTDTGRTVQVKMDGFEDAVVWNPGHEKAAGLSDLAPGEVGRFVCVEAARIGRPISVAPGAFWEGTCRLVAGR